jgi:hypothetical protein
MEAFCYTSSMIENVSNVPNFELEILDALYTIYKLNMNNKVILEQIDRIAWPLCFGQVIEGHKGFHSFAELVQGNIARGGIPDEMYTEQVEDALKDFTYKQR